MYYWIRTKNNRAEYSYNKQLIRKRVDTKAQTYS